MKRLELLQDIPANEVLNMFAMNVANDKITDSGDGDAGVLVTVASGNMGANAVDYHEDSFLGFAGGPHMGFNQYPTVQLRIKAAASTEQALGVTMSETANKDENDEKLIRYPAKQRDLNCVYSGQSVPVFTKGLATFTYRAFGTGADKGYVPAPGSVLVQSASAGRFTGMTEAAYRSSVTGTGAAFLPKLGQVIATGTRTPLNGKADYYSEGTGAYYVAVCKINIA